MKTIEIKLYQFSELEKDIQTKVIEKLAYINVDSDWWENVYEDAKSIGLKITGSDEYKCTGEFINSANEVAQDIFNNHGETCETYKTAEKFMQKWQPLFNHYMDETHKNYESAEIEGQMQDLESDFLSNLLANYFTMLQKEYEYLTSAEAIIETIENNEYTFESDGTMRNI